MVESGKEKEVGGSCGMVGEVGGTETLVAIFDGEEEENSVGGL